MNGTHKPRFDFSQIGAADRLNLSATFLDGVKRFYEDPANIARYEKWKAERAKEASNGTTGRN